MGSSAVKGQLNATIDFIGGVIVSFLMRYRLLTMFILWSINPSIGQDTEKIILVSQEADEPPAKPGPAGYSITFEIKSDEDFVATHINRDNKRRKLSEVAKIEKRRIDQVSEWDAAEKVDFTLLDLGIDRKMIALAAEHSDHKLTFALPDEIVLDVDSFQFCQNYKMTKSLSTEGEAISIRMLAKARPTAQFTCHANDIETGEFKLKEYILFYSILNERIRDEFPHFNFFSKERLAEVVVYYQKTVECEGCR
jgi:hypothetical protein